jgi:hypothetical protein
VTLFGRSKYYIDGLSEELVGFHAFCCASFFKEPRWNMTMYIVIYVDSSI